MKSALRIIFLSLVTIGFFIDSSFASTDEMMNLFQSRDYWTTYKWGKPVSASKLYKSAKWRLRKTDADDHNYYYDTDIRVTGKPTQLTISIDKKSRTVSGYQATFDEIALSGYDELLKWADEVYGKANVYYEFKTKAGEGIFKPYIVKRSSWFLGDTLITLALSADITMKPLVVDLAVVDKNRAKPDKQSTRLICKNMSLKSSPDQQIQTNKMNDLTLVLDENSYKVFDGNLDPTGMIFSASANFFKIERQSDVGSQVYSINKATGKLEGTTTSYGVPSIVSGECEQGR